MFGYGRLQHRGSLVIIQMTLITPSAPGSCQQTVITAASSCFSFHTSKAMTSVVAQFPCMSSIILCPNFHHPNSKYFGFSRQINGQESSFIFPTATFSSTFRRSRTQSLCLISCSASNKPSPSPDFRSLSLACICILYVCI